MKLLRIAICISCIAAIGAAHAEIYRWTDQNGKVHFADRPSAAHTSETVKLRINTYESVGYDTSATDAGKDVVMYSASWCGVCKKARRYFEDSRIAFTEFDIDKNPKARSAYEKLGARGVPVILVGKQRMNGFSIEGFRRIYP